MNVFPLDHTLSAALWIAIKASVLLGVAAVVHAIVRRTSAAIRHLVWALATVAVLALPILSATLPASEFVFYTAAVTAEDAGRGVEAFETPLETAERALALPQRVRADGAAATAERLSWPILLASVYAAGVFVVMFHLVLQWSRVRKLTREATELRDDEWTRLLWDSAAVAGVRRPVRLLRSRECSMPMTFGTRRPTILIPSVADTWPEDRRRAVLLHELAHVARHDCLTQLLAFAACVVYWCHPAMWWVARRLRIERELACDDRVIGAGAQPREYAGHLLEIAYSLGSGRAPALAVTMARPRQLEGRMLAVLDVTRDRRHPSFRMYVAAASIAIALVVPVSSVTSIVVAARPGGDPTLSTRATEPVRIALGAAAQTGLQQDTLPGTWEIRAAKAEGAVHVRLAEANSSSSSNIPIGLLEGLTPAQLTGSAGPVQFRLRRDAGTFAFEGVMRNGVGAGTFSFVPDANFPAELAKRGFARPTSLEQYQLARHDIGYAFVDELNKQGYAKPPTSELVRAGQHGVHLAYVREMGALGYRLGTLETLITLRDHGVAPAYVRELSDLGYKGLPADDLRRARDHGISPEYVRGMRDVGHASVAMEQLIRSRDHGVTPEFIRDLAGAGHRNLPLDQVIRARDHGVSIEFVRAMGAHGYSALSIESLIRLRDHGVTPEYVEGLKALGYDRLAADDLVTLRDHGLTPERIREANSRAGTRLPVDQLKRR